ncbi:hypothetical protein M758_UG264700 [Ceratodon purpureus]|nr:hypothetical protein M758_UG264700 [Ceratodon purpureus]
MVWCRELQLQLSLAEYQQDVQHTELAASSLSKGASRRCKSAKSARCRCLVGVDGAVGNLRRLQPMRSEVAGLGACLSFDGGSVSRCLTASGTLCWCG